MALNNGQGPIP